MSEPRRPRRRRIIAAIVVVGALAGGWWWRRSPEGFLVEVGAVEDGSAVVLWRFNPNRGDSREWIAHFDTGGQLDWRRELPGLTSSRALLVIGDMVSVRYTHVTDHGTVDQVVAAYRIAGGDRVWDRVLMSSPGTGDLDVPVPFFQAFSAGGKLVEQVIERGEHLTHVVHVVDPASGQILGHAPVSGMAPVGPVVVADRLILHAFETDSSVVDVSRGASVAALHLGLGGLNTGCVIGDDYVSVVVERGELALVAFHRADPASRRILVQPFHPVEGLFQVPSCGRYKDRLVFVIVEPSLDTGRAKTSIAITDLNGAVLATIAMPFSSLSSPRNVTMRPEFVAFSGTLPRFVPYLSCDDTKEHDLQQYLAMVDLEQARIAWVASKPRALSDEIFHVEDRWYLGDSVTGGDLVAFDGATGQVAAASHGGKALEPAQVGGGKLWLHGQGWGRLDEAPLAVLDARTLAPLFARGLQITQRTNEARSQLGLP